MKRILAVKRGDVYGFALVLSVRELQHTFSVLCQGLLCYIVLPN